MRPVADRIVKSTWNLFLSPINIHEPQRLVKHSACRGHTVQVDLHVTYLSAVSCLWREVNTSWKYIILIWRGHSSALPYTACYNVTAAQYSFVLSVFIKQFIHQLYWSVCLIHRHIWIDSDDNQLEISTRAGDMNIPRRSMLKIPLQY